MADNSFKSLVDGVAFALARGGTSVLSDPQRFLSYLCDTTDQNSVEMRVLVRCCDNAFLDPFASAVNGGAPALRNAAARAYDHLVNDWMIEPRTAARVSQGVAEGIAHRFGMTLAQNQQQAAPVAMPGRGHAQVPPQPTYVPNPGISPTPAPNPAMPPMQRAMSPAQPAMPNDAYGYGNTGAQQPMQQPYVEPGYTRSDPRMTAQTPPQVAQQPQMGFGYAGNDPRAAVQTPPQVVTPPTPPAPTPKKKFPIAIVAAVVAAAVIGLVAWRVFFSGTKKGVWLTTKVVTVNADGEITNENHYERDEHGNVLHRTSYWSSDDGFSDRTEYSYSDYDNYGYPGSSRTTSRYTFSDGDTDDTEWTYEYTNDINSSGRITERSSTESYKSGDYTDTTENQTYYTYSGDKLVSVEWTETSDGSTAKGSATYDKYGNLLTRKRETTYEDGDIFSSEDIYTYELASDGTPKSAVNTYRYHDFDGSENESVYELTYDEHGYTVYSKVTDSDGEVTINEYENEYDSNDNIIKSTCTTDGSVTTYEYVYVSDPSFAVKNEIFGKLQ